MSLKFYGPHGVAKETLASGAPIPDGDFFQLTKEDLKEPHNLRLIAEGKVLAGSNAAQKAADDAAKDAEAQAAKDELDRAAAAETNEEDKEVTESA